MKLKLTQQRFTIYGEFSSLNTEPKIISELNNHFKEFRVPLSPISLQTETVVTNSNNNDSNIPKEKNDTTVFFSSNRDYEIMLTKKTITIICDYDKIGKEFTEHFDIFKSDVNYFSTTILQLYKKHSIRLAFVNSFIVDEDENSISDSIFSNNFSFPDFIMKNQKREWGFNVVNRIDLTFNGKTERVNDITIIKRALNDPISNSNDGNLKYTSDLNTIPQNRNERFEIIDIDAFLNCGFDLLRSHLASIF